MYTNRSNYLFYSADIPQQKADDPTTSKLMLVMGVIYIAVFILFCLFI